VKFSDGVLKKKKRRRMGNTTELDKIPLLSLDVLPNLRGKKKVRTTLVA
jgi:hypothetical protein